MYLTECTFRVVFIEHHSVEINLVINGIDSAIRQRVRCGYGLVMLINSYFVNRYERRFSGLYILTETYKFPSSHLVHSGCEVGSRTDVR